MPVNAVILAAGEGTRMKSEKPKVLHEILGRSLIEWSVFSAREAGAQRIIVVVGHGADAVREHLSGYPDVECVEQSERLGTGHAVRIVRDAIGGFAGPTVVLYGDTPLVRGETIAALIDETRQHHNACTLLSMRPANPSGYGRIVRNKEGELEAIIEDKDCTPEQHQELLECNSGIYCFCGRRLSEYIDKLTNNNVQGEYYITDMVGIYREAGEPVAALLADDYSELLGINSRSQLSEAGRIMQARINNRLMDEGVSMLAPELVWVGPDVVVGKDTELLPMTWLSGKSSVGTGCIIGPNTRLTDCEVHNNVRLEEVVGIEAIIEDGADAGPRAYLRKGTHLGPGAHVGTHVELKNSYVGAGSKVPHLSYIGDTTMGEGVNIGAGSITCNYDGKNKHKTTIGDRVFVGSDTMMVAPVSLGDDSIIGASSCITQDVPAGALALERSRQTIIEGYSREKKEQK